MRRSFVPDPLPADLADALERSRHCLGCLGSTVLYFATIGSTNDVASALAASGDREGALVIAQEQTAGRGRRGRVWFSPPGSGLYVSLVLRPARGRVDSQRATTLLTLAAGVALVEAIETVTGLRADLKWPNDLQIARRKVGGVLAEAISAPVARASQPSGRDAPTAVDSVVLGYGINVQATAYPPELRDQATSIESELGRPVDREWLLIETLVALSRRYEHLLDGRFDAILDAWRQRAPASHGAHVTWHPPAGPRTGVTAGIDDQGALLIRVGDRVERIVAGEVTWL